MATEGTTVRRDRDPPFTCPTHSVTGSIHSCPYPGCPKGAKSDVIEIADSTRRPDTYRRCEWKDPALNSTYTWEGFPQYSALTRRLWAEAEKRRIVPSEQGLGTIYHYTSAEAFLSIIKNCELWLSNHSYLNDSQELIHGLEIARARFSNAAAIRPEAEEMLQHWAKTADGFNSRICLASFSRKKDSLSQWRAYGPIAIGFNSLRLFHGSLESIVSRSVIYNPQVQTKLLDLMAHYCASAYASDVEYHPEDVEIVYKKELRQLFEVVSFFKNPAFEEESEVRMAYIEDRHWNYVIGTNPPDYHYRASSGFIVPYMTTSDIALKAANDKEPITSKLPINEVVIGPTRYAETLVRGVKELLKSNGYDEVVVRISSTPYRA